MKNNEVIQVKSRMFFRIWLFLATGGAFIAGMWLVSEALTFQSKYALLYLGVGLMAIVYGLITLFMAFPAFTSRGNVIFSVKTGPDGEIFSRKRSVRFPEIKRMYMGRHRYSLKGIFFEDIIIEKIDGKVVRLPTWNIIAHPLFFEAVECYILPHLKEEAKSNWISQFTEVQRNAYLKEFENNPKL
ncbi:YfjD family protein [Bacillus tequilensis]|uniref:YfjD family protein n=1 Tax=Bacillus tequilensis TaxID=227866 RepID=A0A6H0WI81_9BACI|nr:YfjD family protein [Bacillus tequilensis]QIW79076.1 YfjD family protein [Bacillus tequilensis]